MSNQILEPGTSSLNISVPQKLVAAFVELQEIGYFAKANFWCCSTCALYAIPDNVEKFVYYHDQDAECLQEKDKLYLGWGGNGQEICSTLNKHNIPTEWDGSSETRILASEVK